jgi:rubredoxin
MDQKFDSPLCGFSPQQFALIATVLGLVFTYGLNANEQGSLGNFFSVIGQVLQTTSAQSQLLQENCNSKKKIFEKIDELKQQIRKLEQDF